MGEMSESIAPGLQPNLSYTFVGGVGEAAARPELRDRPTRW